MAIVKIYRQGNYIRVVDAANKSYNGIIDDVFIDKTNESDTTYSIDGIKGFDESITIGSIQKQDGSAYTALEWEAFYVANTGHGHDAFVADETNLVATYLLNGGSFQQAVDGSVTPVEFSYAPPAGYKAEIARIVFYMEGTTAFDATKFGNLTKLTNGWIININGVDAMVADCNKALGTYMFDLQGVKIYGKEDKTIIGRFSFNKITPNGKGLTIRDGQSFKTIVKDDLSGLAFLEAKIMGVLIKV